MLLTELSKALLDASSMEVSMDIATNTSHLVYIVDSADYLVATSTGDDDYFDFDRCAQFAHCYFCDQWLFIVDPRALPNPLTAIR